MENPYRALPSVEKLAAAPEMSPFTHEAAVEAARVAIDEARERIKAGEPAGLDALAARAASVAAQVERMELRRAVNATGVLLHTNLGRATLAPAAVAAVAAVAAGHANLEVDEETGGRGDRQLACAALLGALTDAEEALVVNNNAAATFLVVAALAAGREVVLSRGQMVEIGGHFRLPEVIESAGAHLVGVGTTNRTRIADYERAVGPDTALLLRCHPSNYRVVGFTEEATLEELVALGRDAGVPVVDDIGSGALIDLTPFGLRDEPLAPLSVAAGAQIVCFSGDKLLGGPQAGLVVGAAEWIGRIKSHPLARALRPDKLTLAALEATLRLYAAGRARSEIPILRRLARPAQEIRAAGDRLAKALAGVAAGVEVIPTVSTVGGGSLPGRVLPSFAVAVAAADIEGLARRLRTASVPVYGRIERGRLLLDLRAVDPDEEPWIVDAFGQAGAGDSPRV